MNGSKLVFISLPMSGKTDLEIAENLSEAKKAYMRRMPEKQTVQFCHNFQPDIRAEDNGARNGLEGVWYLGRALEMLSKCDEAYFYGEWGGAKGCRIEYEVCKLYGIPFIFESDSVLSLNGALHLGN